MLFLFKDCCVKLHLDGWNTSFYDYLHFIHHFVYLHWKCSSFFPPLSHCTAIVILVKSFFELYKVNLLYRSVYCEFVPSNFFYLVTLIPTIMCTYPTPHLVQFIVNNSYALFFLLPKNVYTEILFFKKQ